MKKYRFALAAAAVAAAAGASVAQPVFLEKRSPYYTPAEPTGKPADTEFKPDPKASPDPKSLAVPDETFQKTKQLAAKLGSTDYAERQLASKELAKFGRMALPALQEVVTTSDSAEAVQRAEVLMPKAEAEDMKARVGCFLADAKGEFNHVLPGWEKFKGVAGNDKDSRAIFADALKSNASHQMLLAADKTADEANAVLNNYMTKLQGGNRFGGGWNDGGGGGIQPIKPADIIMAVFLEGLYTDKEVVIQPNLGWWGGNQYFTVMNNIYSVPEGSQAVSGQAVTGKAAVMRKLVLQWMDTRETGQGVQTAYNYAQNIYGTTGKAEDKKKLMKYVSKVFEADNGVNGPWQKINILTQYAQQWGKEGVPVVAKAFEDSTNIWQAQNGNPGYDIQMRDFALACAIQMADQKPEDYGFSRTPGYGTGKQWNQMGFFFKDDTVKPVGNPGGGFRPLPGRKPLPVEPKEEPKKEEPKDPKKEEPKKEEKLSQEDRRKAAFKKWDEYVKAQDDKKDDKKDPKADPKGGEKPKDAPKDTTTTPPPLPGGGPVPPGGGLPK